MEESKTSENENHEPKKNAWALSEESKAVKVITNQTLKAKNDKSIKEIGTSSPNKNNSKKNKQNDICIEKTEVKSCKVNAASVPGKDLVLRDQSHCRAKKSPNSPAKAEKLPVSQAKVERAPSLQAKTEKPSKSPNSPVKTEKTPSSQAIVAEKTLNSQRKAEKAPGSQMKSEKVPSLPAEAEKVPSLLLKENMRQTELQHIGKKIPSSFTSLDKVNIGVAEEEKPAMENSQRSQKQQTCTDNTGDSDDSASGTEDISDDLSKMKSDESNKENSSEMDYLENATVIDESTLTPEQRLGLKQAEERLERDHIFRLEKRSPEYTNCRYLCKLCLIHIENIQGAHKHIKEKRHKKNILEKQEESELRSLPPPSLAHLAALSVAVTELAKEQGITDDDLKVRQEIVEEMSKVITTFLPECSLRLYGSSLTKFALKSSDVNIDIKFPPKMNHPDLLIQVLGILKKSVLYVDVESDFHAKVPVVVCKDRKSGLLCRVSAGNDMACLTTDLLAALGKMEPVFTPLVLAFRYWAKLCYIDSQTDGGIPSYCFALMVMFFLQQRKPPLLPCLLGSWIEGFDPKRMDDFQLKGIVEEKFVKWEYNSSSATERNSIAEENKAKADQPKDDTKKTETTNQSNARKEKYGKSPLTLETPNRVSLGQLWLELLKFYTLDFALEEYVICVRIKDILTRENKNWPKRRIAIEDPFSIKRNVARSLNSQLVYEYVVERFRAAYRYFACPQKKGGNKSTVDSMKKEKGKISNKKPVKTETVASSCCTLLGESTEKVNAGRGQPDKYNEMECTSQRCITEADNLLVNDLDLAERGQESSSLSTSENSELEPKSIKNQDVLAPSETCFKKDFSQYNCIDYKSPEPDESSGTDCRSDLETKSSHQIVCTDTSATSCNCKATEDASDPNDDENHPIQELYYVFDKFILTSGKPPTIVCSICKKDGHSKNDCPEDFRKIDLKPLPPMTNRFRDILDLVCKRCFDELSPPFSEQHNREQILIGLEKFIQKEYDEKARLCLFGSSKNGFGFRDSDLDICMTLEGHENAEKLNCKEIIENLAKILKRHPGLRNILPITTAKVPIVKFEHRRSGLEGDISLYNTLAQHNTRMLATYAAIDPRVQYLGYTMKVFAKRCDIGDASRGSLSSYAYILMVLYFLQQRKPPVIPVLQEIFDGKQIPQRMVDGWNAFFFDKTEELKKRLPSLGKNTETLGELWLGLLRFYTEEFDFKEYVISIRQKKLLTTFEKQWTSKCIAIEDPFDLNHNLGAGVSRKMTNFIMKAFINGRKLFGTPFYPLIGREAEYFFDSRVLTDGELAPNDRCCRVCGKIGHYMKDCPKRRSSLLFRLKKKDSEEEKEGNEEEKDSRDLLDPRDLHDTRDFRDPRDLRCFICGDAGHVRRECPEVKLARQRNSSVAAAQLVRNLVNAQQVAGSAQQQGDQSIRTRQSSECSDSPSYSPQPQPFPQNSSQSTAITQPPSQPGSQPKLGPPQQGTQHPHQVQMPMYNFPQSPPAQYSPMHNMGLLPMHPLQIPAPSWPIHGPVIHSAPGSAPSNIGLNDPSIIFAQPAARPVAIPSSSHDGHWPRTVAPNSLVNNGTVGNSEPGFPGLNPPIPWEHAPRPHFPLVPASWPYGLHQNFMHQGNARFQPNKPFYTQAGLQMHSNQPILLSQGYPYLSVSYIQQKK
ncbi:terminal uridylyltransferase 4 isoform X1 [Bubalus kerabau]|uniref:terminal uridylyltransferase 4 isoform X1 n=2 Tax=Bubalus bubalis TaxID=89462 RepID=UPI001D10DEB6|nr:terminal uridylyltransferase 4 isoform X1 [Bubalus bubalis]XP_044800953.1 terminal uridylyltransferase 4 isoform X1 [Bubalus bubalis]XP_055441853.1 terminal uridylyltransferase 4 isoform X1 [Bubalus carabanensis]XP_055441855.1 terminal uridylyltransferase 4 isoform X1 [Bubalus carabanensis]XP_055441856.1 terminal uridylyltransferase 4 isoform X1 [Bubalus carabanensis]